MESQQLVDYIREQLATGYTEANLRPYLAKYGWSEQAINDAFAAYYQSKQSSQTQAKAKKTKRREHVKRVRASRWTKPRFIKLGVSFAVLALVAFGVHFVMDMRAEKPAPPPKLKLSYTQKQSGDVSLVGGAVAQFAATYGDLPSQVMPASDGGLAFCGKACGSSQLTLGSPQVYPPSAVKLVSYTAGLKAPDEHTMYLVPAAKCASATSIGGTSTSPRSIVILYARAENTLLKQRCVTL
jgi:hypothetical protein